MQLLSVDLSVLRTLFLNLLPGIIKEISIKKHTKDPSEIVHIGVRVG